jgi:D-amino-acid oxidase
MSDRVDCLVIGAGVVGLATARALALAGREVIVVERNSGIGEETSSRNSEVIHAGLYYQAGSLKAQMCVQGKALLYAYCEDRQIPHARCGKLVVASHADQSTRLEQIASLARQNGVHDLLRLSAAEVGDREPAISAAVGLWSPSTGIVDAHALMLALAGDLEAANGLIATNTSVESIAVGPENVKLRLRSGDEQSELTATTVVNAAGLGAGRLAATGTGAASYSPPETFFAKGNYFSYDGKSPFHALVYPLPVDGGLGVHATHDLGGRLRFGPDVEWIEAIDYSVDASRRAIFADAIRCYWPDIDERALSPGYAGIRPKLSGPGGPWADFRLDLAAADRRRQLMHLLGIESPGLTSALALAAEVVARLEAAAGRSVG